MNKSILEYLQFYCETYSKQCDCSHVPFLLAITRWQLDGANRSKYNLSTHGYFTFTFVRFADAFIEIDLQLEKQQFIDVFKQYIVYISTRIVKARTSIDMKQRK